MRKSSWVTLPVLFILVIALGMKTPTLAMDELIQEISIQDIRAEISPMISYQGRLVENGIPANGDRQMAFSIMDANDLAIWSLPATTVNVSHGLFQIDLGPFDEAVINKMGQGLRLMVQIGDTVLPGQQLTGTPYAFSLVPGAVISGSTSGSIFSIKNSGNGALFQGSSGLDHETELKIIIQNDGTMQQDLGATGLVKAGALVYCAKSGSEVYQQFNNVIDANPITVSDMDITGTCHIDPDFDLSQRFWVVSNPDPTPHIISCAVDYTGTLLCSRFDTDGFVVDGGIMLLIY